MYANEEAYFTDYRLRCENQNLNPYLTNKVDDEINSFLGKFRPVLGTAYMDIDMKHSKAKVRGIPEYECRINLVADRGIFNVSSKGIGVVNSINKALEKLEFQVFKIKGKYNKRVPREQQLKGFYEEA